MTARPLFIVCILASCGSDDTTHHLADSGSGSDNGSGCTTADCQAVAASFTGLYWEIPCGAVIDMYDCAAVGSGSSATIVGATAGETYPVTLHFQGVVEQKTYIGGTTDGYWNVGGTPATTDGYNIYELAISDPAQTYYLNAGSSSIGQTWAIDYVQTVQVQNGATLTLTADPTDGAEILNIDANFNPVTAPNATLVTQPFNGQFIQMDVSSVAAGQ